MAEAMVPMEGATWKAWTENYTSDRKTSLRPSKHVWALGRHFWDSYVSSPNYPNRGSTHLIFQIGDL